MSRKTLINAIEQSATECGYAFHTGQEYRMDAEITTTPALWLLPPQLEKIEGRNEGLRYYKTTLKFITDCTEHSPEAKEELWTRMERDGAMLCRLLCSHQDIKSVTNFAYSPAEFTLTSRGELSLSATFTVQVPFSNLNNCNR